MQAFQWTNEQIRSEFPSSENLEQIIGELERRAESQGEVVCEVRVNGLFLSEQEETRFATERIENLESLSVIMKTPEDLAFETLLSNSDLVFKLRDQALQIASHFQSGSGAAHQELPAFLEACRWLTDALVLLKRQYANSTLVQDVMGDWDKAEHTYIGAVQEMLASFEKRDDVLLADVLEYEMSAVFETWHTVLQRVIQRINKPL